LGVVASFDDAVDNELLSGQVPFSVKDILDEHLRGTTEKPTNKLEPWQRCIVLPKQASWWQFQSILICSGIVSILVLPQDPFVA
jgi:hypothetical protein